MQYARTGCKSGKLQSPGKNNEPRWSSALEQFGGNWYNGGMAKKVQKKKVRESGAKKVSSGPWAQAAAAEFLQRIERSRSNFEPDTTPLTPLQEKLVEQIEHAFAGAQCLNAPYVLLCGEAMDDYLSEEVLNELAAREERHDWHSIPDDMLHACSIALCFVGPEAYRFLIPRFMIGALHYVVEIYPGISKKDRVGLVDYVRRQQSLLNDAQRQCLSDFLSLQSVDEETGEYYGRNQFLPSELDEYRTHYDEQQVTHREFGAMLIHRYAERVGLKSGC